MSDIAIRGHCDEKFAAVRDAFTKNFEDGYELGASYAVSIDGEMVVDLWGGFASLDRKRAWERDTIVPVASSSKVIVSLCGLMLVDRGLIDLDAPVATYWPEFAQNGKQDLPVRYLFSHTSGLPGFDGMPGMEVLDNWEEATSRLAAQKPWWEPGTICAYHAMTYGFLIGELVRRTTGKALSDFFREEIAGPLDIGFHLGLPMQLAAMLSDLEEDFDFTTQAEETSTYYRVLGYMTEDRAQRFTSVVKKPWNSISPSGNGVGNARSLAQIGSLMACGGVAKDQRFFSEKTATLPYQEQNYMFDKVMFAPVRWGLGFGLASKEIPLPFPNAFHWGGSGGSGVVMVPEHRASWAYTPNKFSSHGAGDDERGGRVAAEVIRILQES